MGDRANVVIPQRDGTAIYLYTHWGGSTLATDVQRVLAKRWRWGDPDYLARILFVGIGAGEDSETGFGISTSPPDNEHPFLVVDTRNQSVRWCDAPRESDPCPCVSLPLPVPANGKHLAEWTFDSYSGISVDLLASLWDRMPYVGQEPILTKELS